jgi:hypothetical protein
MRVSYLADIGRLEHLLAIERLLRLEDARKINELGRVELFAEMEDGSTGVWRSERCIGAVSFVLSCAQESRG